MLWQWLNPRERLLVEFVYPFGICFGAAWWKFARASVLTAIFGIVMGLLNPNWRTWTFIIGFAFIGIGVLKQTLHRGQAFATLAIGGNSVPRYAHYPVAYGELAQLLNKYTLVQMPLFFAYSLFCVALVAWSAELSQSPVLGSCVKASILLVALRYISIVSAFSFTTNDTSRITLRSLVPLIIVLIQLILFVAAAGYSLVIPWDIEIENTERYYAWIACGFALLDAYVFYRIYGWAYNSNRFDLVASAPGP
jgi:hypothetical protein